MGGGESHTLIPANPILPQVTLPCGGDAQPLSSSTESAHHDDSASAGSSMDKLSHSRSPSKRRTSKIPLKYSAPKHPTETGCHAQNKTSSVTNSNSSIPKYQKDTSSWQSRKSGESLNGVLSVSNQGSRNWESSGKTTSSHVVKKPAILSNKELSLAQSRRDSTGMNIKSSAHAQGKGAPPSVRMRKTSSESSNSSSSSPRYARDPPLPGLKKHAVRPPQPQSGPEPKLKPPTPLRKLGRPHRSRSLEKSSIITLPALDEVNECPDSLDIVGTSPRRPIDEQSTREADGDMLTDSTQTTDTQSTKETNGDLLTANTQHLVKDVTNNSETYVVKKPEVRMSIPAFPQETNVPTPTSNKSHTYRVRKPMRSIQKRDSNAGHTSKRDSHESVYTENNRIEGVRNVQQRQSIPIQKLQNSQNNPILANSSTRNHTIALSDDVRHSIEYFDSIETTTSASGSVFFSAPGSSMNSNRPVRESMAECDSLDQSQPDISDSEDLV
ncbi:hypothetical protein WDU94_010934 [Cyamophila willieti]